MDEPEALRKALSLMGLNPAKVIDLVRSGPQFHVARLLACVELSEVRLQDATNGHGPALSAYRSCWDGLKQDSRS